MALPANLSKILHDVHLWWYKTTNYSEHEIVSLVSKMMLCYTYLQEMGCCNYWWEDDLEIHEGPAAGVHQWREERERDSGLLDSDSYVRSQLVEDMNDCWLSY